MYLPYQLPVVNGYFVHMLKQNKFCWTSILVLAKLNDHGSTHRGDWERALSLLFAGTMLWKDWLFWQVSYDYILEFQCEVCTVFILFLY